MRICSFFAASVLILILLCPLQALGQSSSDQPPPVMNLGRCLKIAFARSLDYNVALNRLEDTRSTLVVAENVVKGNLSSTAQSGGQSSNTSFTQGRVAGGAAYQMPAGDSTSITGGTNVFQGASSLSGDFTFSYDKPLMKGSTAIVGSAQRFKARRDLSREELKFYIFRQDMAQDIISQYYLLVQARQMVDLSQANVDGARDALHRARRRFEEGQVPKIDEKRAEIYFYQSQDGLLRSAMQWESLRDKFMIRLGLDPRVNSDVSYKIEYQVTDVDETASITTALQVRKEIEVLRWQMAQNDDDVYIARNAKKPSLDFTAGYTSPQQQAFLGQAPLPQYPSWSTGLNFSQPLWDVSFSQNLKRTLRTLNLTGQAIEDQSRRIVAEVKYAVRQVSQARSQIELNEKKLGAARESLRLATRSWEEGLSTNREVIDAQGAMIEAQTNLAQAKIAYILAQINLKRTTGEDLCSLQQTGDSSR
ncbi:MAG: TolC family protein [bacterium]